MIFYIKKGPLANEVPLTTYIMLAVLSTAENRADDEFVQMSALKQLLMLQVSLSLSFSHPRSLCPSSAHPLSLPPSFSLFLSILLSLLLLLF